MAKAPSKTPTTRVGPVDQQVIPGPGANVDYVRPELEKIMPQYTLIEDAIAGSIAVKAKRTLYLPQPNAYDKSVENMERYAAYVLRAVYYGVSERTLAGFIGQVFNVDPIVKVPPELDVVVKDAGGDGVTLIQQAQACEETVLKLGRAGLLTDYPSTTAPVTVAQRESGAIRPTITLYQPQNVINWRTITVGGKIKLSLVVLKETYEAEDTGFSSELKDQYRVLRLVDGYYVVDIWRGTDGTFAPVPELHAEPRRGDGSRFTDIPFTFVGAVDNSHRIDKPPMFAICDLNIAHYRNSADYEEAVYITGQATPVLSGLDERWVNEILKGRIELGSRAAIVLPENAKAELLQMEERSAAFTAMEHKERQMVALGAKLVEQQKVQRTATEAKGEEAAETSVLALITDNVSAAYTFALEWAAIFHGVITERADENTPEDSPNALLFKLNTDFEIASVGPEEAARAIEAWIKEAITFDEMRTTLKKAKFAYKDDMAARQEIQQQRMDDGNFDRDNGLGEFAHDDAGGNEE